MRYDAAIVGGGLAGCSAAISLVQRHRRVILLEAKKYPHHKVCGEFLSPECVDYFEGLGLDFHALKPIPIRAVNFITPNGTRWSAKFPAIAWGISRYTLDEALANHARQMGVEICEGTTVTGIQGNLTDGFTLTTHSGQIPAKTVIAAHGKRGALDRALNRSFLKTPQPFIGLKAHFQNLPMGDQFDMHIFPGGYIGMSEVEGGLTNVCLLVRQDIFQKAGGEVTPFIAWIQAQNRGLADRLRGAKLVSERWLSISQIPFIRKQLVENDILMAGDSAGVIAPLAGDGMAMAIFAGKLAAGFLDRFLAGEVSAEEVCRNYSHRWRREFGERLWLGRALQLLMLRPRLIAPGLQVLNLVPPLGNFLIRHTRDMSFLRKAM